MPLSISPIPLFSDNYAWILYTDSGEAAVVDPGEAGPVMRFLNDSHLALSSILITHNHHDHDGGVAELRRKYVCRVIGPSQSDGKSPTICGTEMFVIATPGHTRTHVAYHFPSLKALFTGDTLFSAGCGRLFEGSAEDMWRSLSTLASLDDKTLVYCGHEYTGENLEFALSVEPHNATVKKRLAEVQEMRRKGLPTAPSVLSEEKKTNPFLRAADTSLRKTLGMESASDAAVFAELRRRKDRF